VAAGIRAPRVERGGISDVHQYGLTEHKLTAVRHDREL
jgi:hypothetical protein